jgi:hypothetical protein
VSVQISGSIKPDDDFRLKIDEAVVLDPRRNAGAYSLAERWTIEGEWPEGTLLEVDVFDGWQEEKRTVPWIAEITWSDGHVSQVSGGSLGTPQPSDPSIPHWYHDLGMSSQAYFSGGPWGTITEETHYLPNGAATLERSASSEDSFWKATQITHGAIKRGLDLQDSVNVEADLMSCEPLLLLWRKLIGTLDVTISRAEVSGGQIENKSVVFAGDVRSIKASGGKAVASCGIPRVFDGLLPPARFAPVCQWALYSTPCGLLTENWMFEGRVTFVGTPGYPFTFVISDVHRSNGDSFPENFGVRNWFAWGMLRSSTGETIPIRQSSGMSSLTVTLARDPNPMLQINEAVQLYPGCDGLPETCQSKFDNFVNWGGARVAAANLSLVKVNLPSGDSGGKK